MIETFLAINPWTLLTFMGAAFILYITPGPDMMFTLASGALGGPRAGVAAAVGISLGVFTHCLLAAAGLAALIAAHPGVLDVIRYAGAAYLLFVAWHAWRDADAPQDRKGRASVRSAIARGYLTNILNPKVGLFVLAFLPQFTDPAVGPVGQQIVILGLVLSLGGVITDGAYGVFAGVMAQKVKTRAKVMNRVSAIIFGGLAVRLMIN